MRWKVAKQRAFITPMARDKADRDGLMERTRAARCYADTRAHDPGIEMAGFLAIFHPDMDEERRRELVRAARGKK
jgi:hypothetical protein